MNELAKTIATRFKRGESMQGIAETLGITYAEVQVAVREVMNSLDRERFAKNFTRVLRHRYPRNYYGDRLYWFHLI